MTTNKNSLSATQYAEMLVIPAIQVDSDIIHSGGSYYTWSNNLGYWVKPEPNSKHCPLYERVSTILNNTGTTFNETIVGQICRYIEKRAVFEVPFSQLNKPHNLYFKDIVISFDADNNIVKSKPAKENYNTAVLPIEPNFNIIPEGKGATPLFDSILARMFNKDGYDLNELKDIIYKYLGAALLGYRTNHILVFLGSGANGKSTFFDIIKRLYTSKVCYLSEKDISDKGQLERISVATYNKSIAFIDEISSTFKPDEAIIKALSTSETLPYRELFHETTEAANCVNLIIGTNDLPYMKKHDNAIQRRFITLMLGEPIPTKDQIKDFSKKIVDIEGQAILAKLIYYGIKYLKEGITKGESIEKSNQEYFENNSPVKEFIDEALEQTRVINENNKDAYITSKAKEVFDSYLFFCRASNYHPLGKKRFYKELESFGFPKRFDERKNNVYDVSIKNEYKGGFHLVNKVG